ncbi:hypothetical protein F2P81_019048 [Scophthalmus maximus]|uniref:Uncharacterized protein n=1 Tax=Scophthalmus maximus TaxID=52904 RepID=A0A6A4S6A1_SCOMX|nr:hypothetical protein F2P81_019048 [Scophthalmus maximus]
MRDEWLNFTKGQGVKFSEITARFEFANVQRYIRGGISGCGFSAARNSEYRSAVKLYTKDDGGKEGTTNGFGKIPQGNQSFKALEVVKFNLQFHLSVKGRTLHHFLLIQKSLLNKN